MKNTKQVPHHFHQNRYISLLFRFGSGQRPLTITDNKSDYNRSPKQIIVSSFSFRVVLGHYHHHSTRRASRRRSRHSLSKPMDSRYSSTEPYFCFFFHKTKRYEENIQQAKGSSVGGGRQGKIWKRVTIFSINQWWEEWSQDLETKYFRGGTKLFAWLINSC